MKRPCLESLPGDGNACATVITARQTGSKSRFGLIIGRECFYNGIKIKDD